MMNSDFHINNCLVSPDAERRNLNFTFKCNNSEGEEVQLHPNQTFQQQGKH